MRKILLLLAALSQTIAFGATPKEQAAYNQKFFETLVQTFKERQMVDHLRTTLLQTPVGAQKLSGCKHAENVYQNLARKGDHSANEIIELVKARAIINTCYKIAVIDGDANERPFCESGVENQEFAFLGAQLTRLQPIANRSEGGRKTLDTAKRMLERLRLNNQTILPLACSKYVRRLPQSDIQPEPMPEVNGTDVKQLPAREGVPASAPQPDSAPAR